MTPRRPVSTLMYPPVVDPGLPRVLPMSTRLGWLSPFKCRRWGCGAVIASIDYGDVGVGLGQCLQHESHGRGPLVPIAIYGDGGVGWCAYPMDVRVYSALKQRGAFNEDGTTRPIGQWSDPPIR